MFKVACMPAAEFPAFPHTKGLKGFEMPGPVFASSIESTIYAVGVADTRYVLNGLLLDITKEGISFVATDGHRLSIVSLKGSLPLEPARFIVTKKALTEMKRHVTADSPVKVLPNGNSIVFEVGKVTLVSRLIEGTYPDYARVIPQGHQSAAVVNREALLKAARRVSLMNEQNAIRLTFAKDLVSVAASSADLGDAEDQVEEYLLEVDEEIRAALVHEVVNHKESRQGVERPVCAGCGQPMQDKGMKHKTVVTRLGEVTIEREYD